MRRGPEGGVILPLIYKCFNTLVEMDFASCNLSFQNAHDLFKLYYSLSKDDAEIYTSGVVKGLLRKINLSYNSFQIDKVDIAKHSQN